MHATPSYRTGVGKFFSGRGKRRKVAILLGFLRGGGRPITAAARARARRGPEVR
jgi:hypothetical protein